jgi:hypothetical protein
MLDINVVYQYIISCWCPSNLIVYGKKVLDWKFKNSLYIYSIWLAKKENIGSQPQNISYQWYVNTTFSLLVTVRFAFIYENLKHRQWYVYIHSLDAEAIENFLNW